MDRVTLVEAAKMLDMGKNTVIQIATNNDWDVTKEGIGRHKKLMYLRSDVLDFAAERKRIYTPIKFDRSNKAEECRMHVAWADSLDEWPSDEEIDARTSDVYRRKDLESVLDTRVFRFNDPKKALRQPAMRIEDRRGRLMT